MTVTPAALPPRLADWEDRLTRYLAEVDRADFRIGALDCALFADGAIEAQTGVTLAGAWRGAYSTFEDGLRLLAEVGVEDHIDLTAALLPEVSGAEARPGDIAAVLLGRNLPSLGVVQGEFIYVLAEQGPRRLLLIPRETTARYFRVGGNG